MVFPEGVRLLDFVKDAAELSLASMESTVTTDAEGNVAISGPRMSGEALARDLLTRFSFPTQRWQDHVSKFSGGEKRRLQLMYILAQRPNFLVLDEPTNDLDLQTLAVLEEFLLEAYDGVLIIVSHDRRFVDKTTKHLFCFQGEGVVADFQGSFTEWLEMEREEKAAKAAAAGAAGKSSGGASSSSAAAASNKPKRKGLSGKDKKELDGMEKQITKLQKQKAEYEAKLSSQSDAGYSQLAEWQKRMDAIQEEIDAKEERWMELMELAEA